MENSIKIGLVVLLFLCLTDMPYGYFQFVRFISMFAFIYFGLKEVENSNIAFIYFGLAVLFQPIIKISLGRELWNFIDVIVGIWLLISIFQSKQK